MPIDGSQGPKTCVVLGPGTSTLVAMSGLAFPTPGEAATAYVQDGEHGLEDVELLQVETDGVSAAAALTATSADGPVSSRLFALNGEEGWTIYGASGGTRGESATWVSARGSGEAVHDGRKRHRGFHQGGAR